jgi:hypothetical protein
MDTQVARLDHLCNGQLMGGLQVLQYLLFSLTICAVHSGSSLQLRVLGGSRPASPICRVTPSRPGAPPLSPINQASGAQSPQRVLVHSQHGIIRNSSFNEGSALYHSRPSLSDDRPLASSPRMLASVSSMNGGPGQVARGGLAGRAAAGSFKDQGHPSHPGKFLSQ